MLEKLRPVWARRRLTIVLIALLFSGGMLLLIPSSQRDLRSALFLVALSLPLGVFLGFGVALIQETRGKERRDAMDLEQSPRLSPDDRSRALSYSERLRAMPEVQMGTQCIVCSEPVLPDEKLPTFVVGFDFTGPTSEFSAVCRKCSGPVHFRCARVQREGYGADTYKSIVCPKCGQTLQTIY